jgi:hypothetical protein
MRTGMKPRWSLCVLVMIVSLLLPGPGVFAATPNPGVFPVDTGGFGKSYEGWSAAWWQWVLGQPVSHNPLFDETGADCDVGQQGPVWFLAGNFGGKVTRDCTIPEGKALFFPVLNGFADNIGVDPPLSQQGLIDACNSFVDPKEFTVKIDGAPLHDLDQYLIEPNFFFYTVPEDDSILDLFGGPNNNFPNTPPAPGAVSCGYYLLVSPLSVGKHIVQIVAEASTGFALHITYKLEVSPASLVIPPTSPTTQNAVVAPDAGSHDNPKHKKKRNKGKKGKNKHRR